MDALFIVIDVGSSGAKTFLVDESGTIVSVGESPWDREGWSSGSTWGSIIKAVRSVANKTILEPRTLISSLSPA